MKSTMEEGGGSGSALLPVLLRRVQKRNDQFDALLAEAEQEMFPDGREVYVARAVRIGKRANVLLRLHDQLVEGGAR